MVSEACAAAEAHGISRHTTAQLFTDLAASSVPPSRVHYKQLVHCLRELGPMIGMTSSEHELVMQNLLSHNTPCPTEAYVLPCSVRSGSGQQAPGQRGRPTAVSIGDVQEGHWGAHLLLQHKSCLDS